jgi:hypothetical protein
MTALVLLSILTLAPVAPPPADTIVWHARGPEAPRFAVVEETLSIGTGDGDPDYMFFGELGLAIGLDGSMVVLEANLPVPQPLLRMYDAEGRFVRHLGRTGQGPGEFLRPGGVAAMPDGRFLLADLQQGRMTVYSSSGVFEETWTAPFHQILDGRVFVGPDGTVALWSRGAPPEREEVIVRLAPGGAVIDTLPLPERALPRPPRMEIRDPPRTVVISLPYYPVSIWTWHPQGYFITARTDRYAVDLRIPRRAPGEDARPPRWRPGDPVVSIRAEVDPVPIHPDERRGRERDIQERLRRARGERTGSLGPVPTVKPILSSIHVGDDGRIWVSLHAESERFERTPTTLPSGEVVEGVPWRQTFVYDVFQPNGVYLGRVSFPQGLGRARFRGDEAWGFVRDEQGITTLERYRIHWPDPT